jgi:hypothetical protein
MYPEVNKESEKGHRQQWKTILDVGSWPSSRKLFENVVHSVDEQ